jgi:glucokinase
MSAPPSGTAGPAATDAPSVAAYPRRRSMGVDFGGTKLAYAYLGPDGIVANQLADPAYLREGPRGAAGDVLACLHDLERRGLPAPPAVGVGVAAQVTEAGAIRFAPNLGWRDVPFRSELENAVGLPTVVVNDVRAATWGEWQLGAGRGSADLVCLFVGTGVGGGIVSGGRVLEGASHIAGELGHTTLVAGGRICHCHNRGCLEAYVGGWAIAERAREVADAEPANGRALLDRVDRPEEITAATVGHAYRDGDPLARRLVEETAEYLASGVVGLVNGLNPRTVVLGGGVIEGLPELIPPVAEAVRTRTLPSAADIVRVAKAQLGESAVAVGAAFLAGRLLGPGEP